MGWDMNDAGEAVMGTIVPVRNRGMPGGRQKEAGIAKVGLLVELGHFPGQIGNACGYPADRGSRSAGVCGAAARPGCGSWVRSQAPCGWKAVAKTVHQLAPHRAAQRPIEAQFRAVGQNGLGAARDAPVSRARPAKERRALKAGRGAQIVILGAVAQECGDGLVGRQVWHVAAGDDGQGDWRPWRRQGWRSGGAAKAIANSILPPGEALRPVLRGAKSWNSLTQASQAPKRVVDTLQPVHHTSDTC